MPVDDIVHAQDELASHRYAFFLHPTYWLKCACDDIASWQMVKLSQAGKDYVPSEPGIYTLLVQPGIVCHPACSYLMYVGKTTTLKRRFREYLHEAQRETGRPKIMRLITKYPDHTWFCFRIVSAENLERVEDALIAAYLPPANDKFPAEVRPAIGAF